MKNGIVYLVTMYKFGLRDMHSYPLGVYTREETAMHLCYKEEEYRGNKYVGEVLEVQLNKEYEDSNDMRTIKKLSPAPGF